MRQTVWVASLGVLVATTCSAGAGVWSPNGRWVAYQQATEARPATVGALGLLDPMSSDSAPTDNSGPWTYRLWATRLETGDSILLDESAGPISAPAWHPDGTQLAYAKVNRAPDGSARYEVIVQDAPDRKRVLHSRELDQAKWRADERLIARSAVAWGPDGRCLAAPLPYSPSQGGGFVVLRVDDGRVLKSVAGGEFPSFSPVGTRLSFLAASPRPTVCGLDGEFGEPKRLATAQPLGSAPFWTRDGLSYWLVRRQTQQRVEVVRLSAETGQVEWSYDPLGHALRNDQELISASLALDEEGENLFAAARVVDEPNTIVWIMPGRGAVFDRMVPFDLQTPMTSLALATRQKKLFVRLGSARELGPIGLIDLESKKLEALAPDAPGRAAWLDLVLATTRHILRERLPALHQGPHEVERPTLIPMPGQVIDGTEVAASLRRMARIARPLLAHLSGTDLVPPDARLILDYLQGDHAACLASVDALIAQATRPDERTRLLGLRAQLLIEKGDRTRARALLEYLKEWADRPRSRIEEGPPGPLQIVEETTPGSAWMGYLLDSLLETKTGKDRGVPVGNPDNPNAEFALPLDLFNRIDELPPGPKVERLVIPEARPIPPRP